MRELAEKYDFYFKVELCEHKDRMKITRFQHLYDPDSTGLSLSSCGELLYF